MDVNAILTFLPDTLEYRGALNLAIHAAAGQAMDDFLLENIYKPRRGDVYAVPGFNLPADHILFGITPDWRTDFERDDRDLLNCVRAAMMPSTSSVFRASSSSTSRASSVIAAARAPRTNPHPRTLTPSANASGPSSAGREVDIVRVARSTVARSRARRDAPFHRAPRLTSRIVFVRSPSQATYVGPNAREGELVFGVAHIFASFNDTFVVRIPRPAAYTGGPNGASPASKP